MVEREKGESGVCWCCCCCNGKLICCVRKRLKITVRRRKRKGKRWGEEGRWEVERLRREVCVEERVGREGGGG
jgi:hypothetical protein